MPTVGGLTTGVNAIASLNGEIYAGGHDVLGTADLAVWNGAAWAPVSLPDHGNGGSRVRDLGVHNNALYVAGEFDQPNPNDYIGVLSVEGNTRILRGAVGAGTATERSAVHMFLLSDTLYLGGTFQDVNGVPAQSLARYSGGNWSAVAPADSSIDSELLTCTVFDGALVVGGCARVLGGTEVKGIARTIDGRTFTPMGEGFAGGIYGGEVRDTVIHEGSLYAMGNFQASGATGVNNAARWDGAAWQLLGAGVGDNGPLSDDFVNVLAGCSTPQGLVVSGLFEQAGGQAAWSVARWNGSAWDNLGGGLRSFDNSTALVWSVAWHQGSLYAAGYIDRNQQGDALSCVARWDGSKWVDAAAGLPVGSAAARLYVHDGELHMAARHFDGSAFWRVYRLGGASWAPASEALDGGLFWSLFTHDEDLMVGGGIAQLPAYNNLARLGGQGDQLVPMEALELYVRDGVEWNGRIAVVGDHGLLVQNGATTVSTNLALWTPGKPTFYDQPDEQTVCDRQDAVFTIAAVSSNAMTYRWKRNNVPLVDGPTPHGSTIVGAALPMLRVQQSTYQDEGIYTCTATNTCTAVTSDGARLIIGGCSCGPADLGRTGGIPGADGALDNNDFVVFVDLFFQQHPAADFGTTGGVPGADGAFDNNDFVVFIDVFFAGCA